jgi:hypothetical protein
LDYIWTIGFSCILYASLCANFQFLEVPTIYTINPWWLRNGGGSILEIGTYCGYSALRMAMAAPNCRVVSLEAGNGRLIRVVQMVSMTYIF